MKVGYVVEHSLKTGCKFLSKLFRLILSRARSHLLLLGYMILSFAIVVLIDGVQYYRFDMFGTDLLLGWDTPAYVWMAKEILLRGPIRAISAWNYPHLYTQMLAFFGWLTGNIVMVERILPLLFVFLLIYMNFRIVFKATNNVHISGLAAILTATSINVLRLFADLHRNLMAFSLSFVALYLVSKFEEESTWNKRSFSLLLLLFSAIITAQFETFAVLCASLMLYGVFTKNPKKLLMLILVCAIPTASMALLLPTYFVGYMNTVFFTGQHEVGFNELFTWTGDSWIYLGFLVIATYSFIKLTLRKNKLTQLIFSWFFVILLIIVSIRLKLMPISPDFAVRAMFVIPLPVLMALASFILINFVKGLSASFKVSRVYRRLVFLIPICLIAVSSVVVCQNSDGFLTPYVSRARYEKIIITKGLFMEKRLSSVPVFVFYGDPAFWYFSLDRSYIGMEIGEHFAYYGTIENLLRLAPSEPSSSDAYISVIEKQWAAIYFNELIGNLSWSTPIHIHDSYIRSVEDLMSHPIIVVSPEFYNDKIPYFLKPFYVSDGIYIIPPNSSLDPSKITYGPEVTVIKNGTPTQVKSEYTYIDPHDPSIASIKVNASFGYTSYNFTDFPTSWTFQRIEQGGDISFPEVDPRRVNGTEALIGNDPADSVIGWSSPWPEQNATLEIDTSTKKEGYASLKITGKTDSWGNLGVRYNSPRTWNLSGYSSISVWAKSNESTTFSITLVDCYGGSRTFWAIEAGDGSTTTGWKRFVVNLTDYTSQTSGFNISTVICINLYVYSKVKKSMTFWIDDLTVDTALDLRKSIYKDRVPADETVVAYFHTRIEDPQLVRPMNAGNLDHSNMIVDTPSNLNLCVCDKDRVQQADPAIVYFCTIDNLQTTNGNNL
jgi:hypothetical protein